MIDRKGPKLKRDSLIPEPDSMTLEEYRVFYRKRDERFCQGFLDWLGSSSVEPAPIIGSDEG
jgi:hypothetical protein